MAVDYVASNKTGGLTLKLYRGEDMVLLAFDIDDTLKKPDFVGFGIEYKIGSTGSWIPVYNFLTFEKLRLQAEAFVKLHAQKAMLTRQIESMEQSLRLNEMFAAVLGHDLRSPLSAIMVGAELIIVRSKDEADVGAAKRIRDSAKCMSHLISQLIDMARVRSGHVNLSLQTTDFSAACAEIVREVESVHQQRVSVETRGDAQGLWDPHRLSQILSNLIGNAVKHGDPAQPVRVTIDGSKPEQVQCTVHNGGYIAPQLLPHIFKPFRGYDGSGERRAGLGLGLYIVQQLVSMHGGEIGVNSTAADGTRFTMTLRRTTAGALSAFSLGRSG